MAGPLFADRVMESSTTTGTGAYSLAGAVTGFQGFVAGVGDNNSCWYCAMAVDANGVPNGDWEVGIGTVDDASPDTLTRDTIVASSNSNNAVSWAAGTKRLFVTAPAAQALPSLEMGGRLTTESGVPISDSDRTAQGTVYYTPFIHNRIALWNGSGWQRRTFPNTSLALSVTSGNNYDVFGYDNAGTFTLELSAAWTNDTTRADALTSQDGVWVKDGTPTRRWLGTIRASGSNVTEDSLTKRFVANADNRVPRPWYVHDSTNSWTYASTTLRQANGSATNQVEVVCPFAGVTFQALVHISGSVSGLAYCSIGVDSTSAAHANVIGMFPGSGTTTNNIASYLSAMLGVGWHRVVWLEATEAGGSATFYGDAGQADLKSGLSGWVTT